MPKTQKVNKIKKIVNKPKPARPLARKMPNLTNWKMKRKVHKYPGY